MENTGGRAAAALPLSDSDLVALLRNATVPVVVDFWSPWCSPCRAVSAIVSELALEFGEQVVVATVNTVAHPEAAARFEVTSVPTVIAFVGGAPVRRLIGARPKSHFLREISALL